MLEFQFISDLTINMMEGLPDFSAKKIDNYYADYDENFSQSKSIATRLERIFDSLTEIDPETFKKTIFHIPQILFSLMLIIDAHRPKRFHTPKLKDTILKIDELITSWGEVETPKPITSLIYESFTSGNMHRIRYRKERDKLIRKYFK